MQRIAERLNNDYYIGFEEDVKFIVSIELAEKGGKDNEPLREAGDA